MPDLREAAVVTEDIREQAEQLGYEVKQRTTNFYMGRPGGIYGISNPSDPWHITCTKGIGGIGSSENPFWSPPFDTKEEAIAGLADVLRDDARLRAMATFGVRITPWENRRHFGLGADKLCLPMGPYDSPGAALAAAEQAVKEHIEADQQAKASRLAMRLAVHEQNMPTEFHGRDLENFNAKSKPLKDALAMARQYVSVFSTTDPQGLVLCGDRGTGKTSLAVAVAASLTIHDRPGASSLDLQGHYKTVSSAISADDAELIEPSRLLLLDWCELQPSTDSHDPMNLVYTQAGQAVANMLAQRYEANLPTLLIADCDHAHLIQYLGLTASRKLLEHSWEIVQLEKAKEITNVRLNQYLENAVRQPNP
jgi:hypothetical protein